MLFFKYTRSPVFIVTQREPVYPEYMYISILDCYVSLAEEWLIMEKVEFFSNSLITITTVFFDQLYRARKRPPSRFPSQPL